jgi:hypothetical protein
VWNLRLELGHQLAPDPVRTTEFAPALPPAQKEALSPSPSQGYGPAEVALPWKHGRFSGQDFALQPDGTLRCPSGQSLVAHERRGEADGSLRVVYAASIRRCRPCPLREQCQWNGSATAKPRQVSMLLHPLVVGSAPLLWRDWSRRYHRRACIQLLRHQCVEVEVGPPTSASLAVKPVPLSRAQRAHYRHTFSRTAGSQCAPLNGWSGDDQTVRRPRRLCHLARLGDGLNLASVASVSSLLGQACFSEWDLMTSFPGFFSLPLIFCPFRSLSLCFCYLLQAQRPVLHGFRSPDRGLALQQPRCAIRGQDQQGKWIQGTVAQAQEQMRKLARVETTLQVQRGKQRHPKRQSVAVEIAACPVRLTYSTGIRRQVPGEVVTNDLWLVQVRVLGTTQAPWLLLTDWPVEDEQSALLIFIMYRERWAAEDSFKVTKECLGWDEVQMLDWQALETLVALVWVTAGFLYQMGVTFQ